MKPSVIVRQYLAAQSAITTLVGSRIWADAIWPTGYNVTQGPALLVQALGGGPLDPRLDFMAEPRVQLQSMAQTMTLARDLDEAIHPAMDALVGRVTAGVALSLISALVEVRGAEMRHPETEWPLVVSAYRITMKRTA